MICRPSICREAPLLQRHRFIDNNCTSYNLFVESRRRGFALHGIATSMRLLIATCRAEAGPIEANAGEDMPEAEQRKRRGRPKRDEVVALDRAQIVTEALRLIDERGLEGFSLRELARALGVFPTALYWHMPGGRNAVLGAVAATAFTDVVPPAEDAVDDWESWVRALFTRYRDSLRKHPNIAPLLGAQIVSNTGVDMELVERILAALESAGFGGERLVDAYNTVVAGLLGYVTLELAPGPAEDASEWANAFEAEIRSVDASRFPRLSRNLDALANRAFIVRWQGGAEKPMTHSFDFYVETIITGLRALSRKIG